LLKDSASFRTRNCSAGFIEIKDTTHFFKLDLAHEGSKGVWLERAPEHDISVAQIRMSAINWSHTISHDAPVMMAFIPNQFTTVVFIQPTDELDRKRTGLAAAVLPY